MKTLAQFVNSYSIILLIVYHIRLLVGKEAVNRKHIILQQQGHCALGSHEKKFNIQYDALQICFCTKQMINR